MSRTRGHGGSRHCANCRRSHASNKQRKIYTHKSKRTRVNSRIKSFLNIKKIEKIDLEMIPTYGRNMFRYSWF